jgi:hypothetical protein
MGMLDKQGQPPSIRKELPSPTSDSFNDLVHYRLDIFPPELSIVVRHTKVGDREGTNLAEKRLIADSSRPTSIVSLFS